MRPGLSAALASTPSFDRYRRETALLSRIEETLLDGEDKSGKRLVRRLLDQLQARFVEEEKLLRRLGSGALRQHARNHEAALILLEQVDSALAAGNLGIALTRLSAFRLFMTEVLGEQETVLESFGASGSGGTSPYAEAVP